MPHIIVENLVKTFQIAQRQPGVWGALRGVMHRNYRQITALDGISFTIEPGELIGYIGPNGAGKSTTVKVLSGILVPDSGRCEILGRIPGKNASHTSHKSAWSLDSARSCGGICPSSNPLIYSATSIASIITNTRKPAMK